ncbi:hypothetical protein H310_03610 [Aphanomyces invadans]|uniref:Uncharacterized protein n=1 Tax=Aphanomyces invadans TaxID=157072 RepID=A0A024UHU3_9STRA|nr:hypothetical protein H310_03610 [Aphanomyces invadans]ETW05991.1 hypothetical protein H310_03610 [Aphanomyces invadans]|eukprot:XP_008865768.1 hypothetical protein H310_03610 [Aphanomyces invadans]
MDMTGEGTEEQRGAASLLDAVQKELQVHSTAIRIVLTKLAERVVALENRVDGTSAAMHAMETMLHSMTGQMLQLHGSMGEWHEPVQMIQTKLQALGDTCNKLDYATVTHTTLLERQADALQFLNTKLEDTTKSSATTTKHEIEVLVQKTDSFHGHVLQKIEETKSVFATKLEDVSKKVDVLDHDMQGMKETKPAPPPLPPVTVVIPEGTTKIPVELHAKRLAAGKPKEKSGAYTDLKQFRIPDEMHERLEHNLAALYSSDVDDMRRPAIPNVAKLPRDVPGGHNLRFASDVAIDPPTSATSMSYVRLRTQDDSVSASADMRNQIQSKFHALYAMVDAARIDARGKQDALHVIMNRHVETINLKLKQLKDQVHHLMPTAPPAQPAVALLLTGADADGSSVPALRLALLELSRNLHVVRQTRKHMSPDMRRNLDKIVDVLNDAYHVLSSDASPSPAVVSKHTERVARALAFGIQSTVELLSTTDAVSSMELRNTVMSFSAALTARLQSREADEGARIRAATIEQQLDQLKTDTHQAFVAMSARLDEIKQRGTVAALGERSGGPTAVQSRFDINERGKLLASFEHDLHMMKEQMQANESLLCKLSSDMEHTIRLVARYLPNPSSEVDQSSKSKKTALHKSRATLQSLHPSGISTPAFTKQASLSSLCVQNAVRQPIRKAPLTPPTKQQPESLTS